VTGCGRPDRPLWRNTLGPIYLGGAPSQRVRQESQSDFRRAELPRADRSGLRDGDGLRHLPCCQAPVCTRRAFPMAAASADFRRRLRGRHGLERAGRTRLPLRHANTDRVEHNARRQRMSAWLSVRSESRPAAFGHGRPSCCEPRATTLGRLRLFDRWRTGRRT
jgi:hypothetical protein